MSKPLIVLNVEVAADAPCPAIPKAYEGAAVVARRNGRIVGMLLTQGSGQVPVDVLRAQFDSSAPAQRPARRAETPRLTIAICTRNRPLELVRAMHSIVDVCGASANIELLVVDNAPQNDENERAMKAFPGVRYVVEPRPGLSFARNRAIKEATGAFIAYIDDDAVLDRCWLAGFYEAHAENPDAVAFSGPILPFELETEAQVILEARSGVSRAFRKIRYNSHLDGSPYYPCGASCLGTGGNMVFRRDVLLDLGGFDEALGSGMPAQSCEDLDIFLRVIRAGHTTVHEPQMAIFHQNKRDMESLRRQVRGWAVGTVAYMLKAYASDRDLRPKIAMYLCNLGARKAGGIAASLLGTRSYQWPVKLAIAEFAGFVEGFFGAYERSARAVEERSRPYLSQSEQHETARML